MPRSAIARLSTAAVFVAGVAAPATAQNPPVADQAGSAVYLLYCASCHGPNANGDGPAAQAMQPKPPDLTKIAARSGGRFDDDVVFRTIDGRIAKGGHGGAGMPVWGDAFSRRGQSPEETRRKIQSVVQYLKSLQK